jgi:hypothetical protein
VDAPLAAAIGVAVVVAHLVGSTAIGGGDYGQWLMVSRGFSGLATPAYRDLSQVPPLAPALIALLRLLLGDAILALHVLAGVVVGAMGFALYLAGWAVGRRSITGLLAVILGLLVSDQYLDLLAFGALPQALAVVFLTVSIACFARAIVARSSERRWWLGGCAGLFLACLSHVATAAVALPACVIAAGLGLVPRDGEGFRSRIRSALPLLVGVAAIAAYWVAVIAPASVPYVANPASLSYRGPDRLLAQLFGYPPSAAIIVAGGLIVAAEVALWMRGVATSRRFAVSSPRMVLAAWALTSWAAFVASAMGRAATDYPRFAPLLTVPLAIVVADGLVSWLSAIGARLVRRANAEQGLVALALGIVVVAPFSIANYQTEANGYRLPDDASLAAAATWADSRLQPGVTILAPVREAKWIEGLTGRSTLFTSMVRYSFRPAEWDRSLAAAALFRGDLALVNESFVLTLNDGAPTADGEQPRGILMSTNHGGDWVDLLRLVPASTVVVDPKGATIASLPSLAPAGLERSSTGAAAAVTTRWKAARDGRRLSYAQSVGLASGSSAMALDLTVRTRLRVAAVQTELRPMTGVTITDVVRDGGAAVVTFARIGQTEPRVRIDVRDGSVFQLPGGGLRLTSPGRKLDVTLTDLTAGAPSSSLAILDPRELIGTYGVGAAILRRDPAYEDRRDRLELLGFRVAHAEGPYVVMVRAGAGRPAGP